VFPKQAKRKTERRRSWKRAFMLEKFLKINYPFAKFKKA